MSWDRIAGIGMPAWRDGEDLCALADGDRHLGHVVNEGEWQAFDAIHPGHASHGFRHIGTFATLDAAKAAVERAISQRAENQAENNQAENKVKRAGSVIPLR